MSTLPAFTKDIRGQYYGGAFWDNDDFRVHIVVLDGTGEKFLMTVERSDGTEVGQYEFGMFEAEGIARMATTDHGLGGYEDDWVIPPGMGRVLTWDLPVGDDHTVVLNEADISEVNAWLEYATGEKVWDGGEVWEY